MESRRQASASGQPLLWAAELSGQMEVLEFAAVAASYYCSLPGYGVWICKKGEMSKRDLQRSKKDLLEHFLFETGWPNFRKRHHGQVG